MANRIDHVGIRWAALGLFCILVPVGSGSSAWWQDGPGATRDGQGSIPPPPGVTVTATLSKAEYRPLEPIVVTCKVTNTSGREISLPSLDAADPNDSKYYMFEIAAKDGYGRESPPTLFYNGVIGMLERHGANRLKRGDGVEKRLVANLIRDMTGRGKYVVTIEVPYFDRGLKGRLIARSEPLTLRVVDEPEAGKDKPEVGRE